MQLTINREQRTEKNAKMESVSITKSMEFSVRIVKLYKYLIEEKKEYVLSKQLLRSGTSIGANVREGRYAQSKKDFISKMSIALKEAVETEYWLELLERTEYITREQYESIKKDSSEMSKILTAIVKRTKESIKAE